MSEDTPLHAKGHCKWQTSLLSGRKDFAHDITAQPFVKIIQDRVNINDSFYGLWLDKRCVGDEVIAPRMVICDKNDLCTPTWCVGIVIVGSWRSLLIVEVLVFSIPTVFRR